MLVKLQDLYFKPFISEEKIQATVQQMVDAIAEDLKDEMPIFVGILNGSFMFVSDFVKKYPYPCEVTFIKLASYDGVKSTEDIQRLIGLTQDLTGRTVVILEDIIDSGNTLAEVHRIFKNEKVKQLIIATLFYKPEAYKKDFKLHYVGLEIPNKFIVGYGLDYNGLGRDLPAVYQLKTTQHMINIVLFGPPDIYIWDQTLSSIFGVSNIYYLTNKIGYFNNIFDDPLGHTWSLGVEEQFYLLYPFLIFLVFFFDKIFNFKVLLKSSF